MADFFGDLFGAITGQQKATPYTPTSTAELLGQAGPMASGANISYNQAVAPAYRDILLGNETAFDPNSAALRRGVTSNLLEQLGLGSKLPQDVQDQVIRNALQGNAATGFGGSPAGRGLVARDLGLTSLDLLNQRIGAAGNWALPNARTGLGLYQPQDVFAPGEVAQSLSVDAANRQARETEEFRRKEGNKIAMFNTFGRVLGSVAGGIFGGPGGAMMGGNIGGSLISNPYRADTGGGGGGGGGMFSSLLGSFGKGGGSPAGGGGGAGGFGGGDLSGITLAY